MKSLLVAALLGGVFLAMDAQAAGDPAAGEGKIAACAACHGTDGKATAPIYPNLAGQNADYLVRRGIPLAPQMAKSPNGCAKSCSDRWKRLSNDLGSIP
jgi:cytochrome c553